MMKNYTIEIRWAIQFSLVSIVWMIFEKSMGWHDENIEQQAIYTNMFAFVAIGIYFLALRDKKKNFYQNAMTWKEGFLSGMILSTVIAVLSPFVQYITFTFITPNFFKNIIDYVVSNKIQTAQQAEMYFSRNSYIVQGIFGALSFGALTSAILAFVLKSKNNNNEK